MISQSGANGQSTSNPADGKWHNVIWIWNGSSLSLYVDGNAETVTVAGTFTVNTVLNGVLRMGSYLTGGADLSGSLDDVRIYNRALSAAEVANLYQSAAKSYVK